MKKNRVMKLKLSFLIFPLLLLSTGCSTHLSTNNGYGHGHRSSHISVGTHSRGNGAAVVGALIIGGIIGSIVNENEHKEQEAANEMAKQRAEATSQLKNDSFRQQIQKENIEYRETLSSKNSEMQWYQLGKDENCYLMSVNSGVTNIISAVPNGKCSTKPE